MLNNSKIFLYLKLMYYLCQVNNKMFKNYRIYERT